MNKQISKIQYIWRKYIQYTIDSNIHIIKRIFTNKREKDNLTANTLDELSNCSSNEEHAKGNTNKILSTYLQAKKD